MWPSRLCHKAVALLAMEDEQVETEEVKEPEIGFESSEKEATLLFSNSNCFPCM